MSRRQITLEELEIAKNEAYMDGVREAALSLDEFHTYGRETCTFETPYGQVEVVFPNTLPAEKLEFIIEILGSETI